MKLRVALVVFIAFFAGTIPAAADYICFDIFALKNSATALEEFRPIKMLDKYAYELEPGNDRVYYIRKDTTRVQYEWKIESGLFNKLKDGKWQPLNTAVAKKDHRYDETLDTPLVEFVLSLEKKFYGMTRDEQTKVFEDTGLSIHHSTFMGGKAVFFAGNLIGENGRLILISSRSGHYLPTYKDFLIFLRWLNYQGVDLTRTLIHIYDLKKLLEDPAIIREYEEFMPEIVLLAEANRGTSPEFLASLKARIEDEFRKTGQSLFLYRANFVWDQLSPTLRDFLKATGVEHGVKVPDLSLSLPPF